MYLISRKTAVCSAILIMMLSVSIALTAKTIIRWKPLPTTKYWTRRAVVQPDKKMHFYYRPVRFEKMPINVTGFKTIAIKGFNKRKAENAVITVTIDNRQTNYTLVPDTSDKSYYYYKPIEIQVPDKVTEISVSTRNPWVYLRAYGKSSKELIPSVIVLKANTYKRSVNLVSGRQQRSYLVADKDNPIQFTAPYNGSISALFRFLPLAKKSSAKINILVNNNVVQTLDMKHKLSGKYKVNDMKVSVGKKVIIPNIKKGDKITIQIQSNHEVLTRWYLNTK